MERNQRMKGFDRMALINELLQGMEYAKELRNQFSNAKANSCSSLSSDYDPNQALNYSLLEKMLSSFDKTIVIATSIVPPPCISPKSENSHPDFPSPKRRKVVDPKWTKSVQIDNGGLERALEDGFSWRKYGQKDILRAKFPRGYYRCTHRHTKGCAATKQVQRSDDDPTTYQILYRGEHTCNQGGLQLQAQVDPINQAQFKTEPHLSNSPQDQEVYVGLGPEGELNVEPEQQADLQAQFWRSLSFTSAFLEPEPIHNYMMSFSPPFGSLNTSDSNYLPLSPYRPTGPQLGLTVQTSETDNNEGTSGPNSVTDSPIISDFEFPIDEKHDIDIYFS